MNSRRSPIALAICFVALLGFGLCQEKQIGDYKIPVDPLNDNYCKKVDISQFRDIQTIDNFYSGFVTRKLDALKEPVRTLVQKGDFVSYSQFD